MSEEPKRTLDHDVDFDVEKEHDRRPLDFIVRAHLQLSWGVVRELVKRGKVSVNGARADDATTKIAAGAHVEVRPHARRLSPNSLPSEAIAYVDPHVVVVRKPAGISTIPYDDDETDTLQERVHRYLVRHARQPPHASLGVVHRIDKETSGLVVFARTFAAKKQLSNAFRLHAIERRYVAVVHGVLSGKREYRTYLMQDRGDGLRGSAKDERVGKQAGQLAVTHVAPLEKLSEQASLVACALETGRTHQIRIHLSEAAMPVVGDRVYTRDRFKRGQPLIEAPRLMLHAIVLGFAHPITQQPLRFSDPLRDDMRKVIARLAGRAIEVDPDALPL